MIKTNDGQVQTETRRRCKEGREGKGIEGDTKRGFRKRKGKEQGKEKGWIGNERQNSRARAISSQLVQGERMKERK
jgi:hypothetical protein